MAKRALLILTLCCCAIPVYGARDASHNRRNRFRPTKKVEKTVKKKTSVPRVYNQPTTISMPRIYEQVPKEEPKPVVKKPVMKKKEVVESKVEERSSYKRPRMHQNDPVLDINAFYSSLNQEGKDVFSQLSEEGKSLAMRLSFAYVDKNKAVEDAYHEMERRRGKLNLRNKRSRRQNKIYL